jgi:spore coat protein U-like protein
LAGLACLSGPAVATTPVTSTFQVSLQIQAQCLINSTNTLTFPTSGVLITTGNYDATTTFVVQCTNTTPYTIALDKGTTTGGTTTTRLMTNSGTGGTVKYTLWQDAGHSTNWDDTSSLVNSNGTGDPQTFTVYGRVPAQTTPAPATYTDTITVTVTY